MGIGITEGRDFIADDNRKSNFTVIFNQTAQRQYGLTVGERFGEWDIAGIARDFNFKPLQYGIEPIAFAVFGDHPIAKSQPGESFRHLEVYPGNHTRIRSGCGRKSRISGRFNRTTVSERTEPLDPDFAVQPTVDADLGRRHIRSRAVRNTVPA